MAAEPGHPGGIHHAITHNQRRASRFGTMEKSRNIFG